MLTFIDPAGLLFAGALVGVVMVGALIVVRPVAADAGSAVNIWIAAQLAGIAADIIALLQPGIILPESWSSIPENVATLLFPSLIVAAASLQATSLRMLLSERGAGPSDFLPTVVLTSAYALIAQGLPSADRQPIMLPFTLGCLIWTSTIVWRLRQRHRRGAGLIVVAMFLVMVLAAIDAVLTMNAPALPASDTRLPPAFGLIVNLTVPLAMSLGFIVTLFERLHHKVVQMSNTDLLTGALNRRGFMREFDAALPRAQQRSAAVSLALIDIDRFKSINDSLGHSAGDDVLVFVSQKILAGIRADDRLGRWGGEEFVLLMPDTSLQQAARVVDRLREQISAAPVRDGFPIVTFSAGVAAVPAAVLHLIDPLVAEADALLYQAKVTRNCVVMSAIEGKLARTDASA
ncbi:hypothetical protein CO666_16100 [Rhizobium chutanense]|uniref:diguanylate cyclase n=1 Tax=Rhizobium chutanense TaxID=2035448 RepID=A0A2A6JAF3_9HYPH|nr:GGDEF domain-containing protein [Rhizobium chutanense]PDT03095.1 hypothetical protein CO666_16100 [Rhizobium chutanense]